MRDFLMLYHGLFPRDLFIAPLFEESLEISPGRLVGTREAFRCRMVPGISGIYDLSEVHGQSVKSAVTLWPNNQKKVSSPYRYARILIKAKRLSSALSR